MSDKISDRFSQLNLQIIKSAAAFHLPLSIKEIRDRIDVVIML